MDDRQQSLKRAIERTEQHVKERKGKHRADVAHVQQHHPEIADWLSCYVQLFGRGEVTYRVVLK